MQYHDMLNTIDHNIPEESYAYNHNDKKTKPHILRRNIEDYLEAKALKRRIIDIYDDDFLLEI